MRRPDADSRPAGGLTAVYFYGGNSRDLSVAGTLDLGKNDLLVDNPTDPTTLQEQIAAGDLAGIPPAGTNGVIYSSLDAYTDPIYASHQVGYAPTSDVAFANTSVDGVTLQPGGLLARYTVNGDADLDGFVNVVDFNLLAEHFGATPGTTPPAWWEGDFNGDGYVNVTDFNMLAENWGSMTQPLPVYATAGVDCPFTFPSLPTGDTALRWDVNWGDGTTDSYPATTTSFAHAYATAGNYAAAASILATDAAGTPVPVTDPVVAVAVAPARAGQHPLVFPPPAGGISPDDSGGYGSYTGGYTVAGSVLVLSSDGQGDTLLTLNGTLVAQAPTADLTDIELTGGAAELDIDNSLGDPVPPAGVFFDGGVINFGAMTGLVLATGTETTYDGMIVRHPAATALDNTIDDGQATVVALSGEVNVTDTFYDSELSAGNNGSGFTDDAADSGAAVDVMPGATAIFDGSQTTLALNVTAGGTSRVEGPAGTVLTVGALTLAAPDIGGNDGGILDLGESDLILTQTDPTEVSYYLADGYNGGNWNGDGQAAIVSSSAANDEDHAHAIGWGEIGMTPDTLNLSSFGSQLLASGDVLLHYTVYGDADLNGVVDSADQNRVTTGYSFGLDSWANGDFNYDGGVDDTDLNIYQDAVSNQFQVSMSTSDASYQNGEFVEIDPDGDTTNTVNFSGNVSQFGAKFANGFVQLTLQTPEGSVTPPSGVQWYTIPIDSLGNFNASFAIASNTTPGSYQLQFSVGKPNNNGNTPSQYSVHTIIPLIVFTDDEKKIITASWSAKIVKTGFIQGASAVQPLSTPVVVTLTDNLGQDDTDEFTPTLQGPDQADAPITGIVKDSTKDTISFHVEGLKATAANIKSGDLQVVLVPSGGDTVTNDREDVRVVVPTTQTHQVSQLAKYNVLIDTTTKAFVKANTKTIHTVQPATVYYHTVVISIADQYGDPIDAIYNGTIIYEKFGPVNQGDTFDPGVSGPLFAGSRLMNGVANDPVFVAVGSGGVIQNNTQDAADWVKPSHAFQSMAAGIDKSSTQTQTIIVGSNNGSGGFTLTPDFVRKIHQYIDANGISQLDVPDTAK